MRPSGTHLYKRVCPSVGPSVGPSVRRSVRRASVGPLRLCEDRVSRLFLATVRSYTETNDQPTYFESLFIRRFVHLSLHTYVTWSIYAETQPGRIVARSGLFHFLAFIHSPLLPKCLKDLCHWPSHPTEVAVYPALFVNEVQFSFTEMKKKLLKNLVFD